MHLQKWLLPARFFSFSLTIALAQTTTGTITGTLTDPSGAIVTGTKVSVVNEAEGSTRELITNNAGVFTAPNLTVGTYRVLVSAPGFANFETGNLILSANQVLNVDAHLSVASAGTSV